MRPPEDPPLGPVTVLGAHILDVLGRPVEAIPPGQGSVRLREIRATAAGTTPQDRANLGHYTFNDLASVRSAAGPAADSGDAVLRRAGYKRSAPWSARPRSSRTSSTS